VTENVTYDQPTPPDYESKYQDEPDDSKTQSEESKSESESNDDYSELDSDREDVYEVERIIGHREDDNDDGYSYKVKWVGYRNATWEPAESLIRGAREIFNEYRRTWDLESSTVTAAPDSDKPSVATVIADGDSQ
jgi:hypothetical protein